MAVNGAPTKRSVLFAKGLQPIKKQNHHWKKDCNTFSKQM